MKTIADVFDIVPCTGAPTDTIFILPQKIKIVDGKIGRKLLRQCMMIKFTPEAKGKGPDGVPS